MSESAKFKDFNFKLAVINKLMYERNVIKPRFEIGEFIKNFFGRRIDINEEGFESIPEIERYFDLLVIPVRYLADIEEIHQDGGDEIYMQICPLWDGEDDRFNIQSATDAVLLPKLKAVTLFYDENTAILEEFREKGISARWL